MDTADNDLNSESRASPALAQPGTNRVRLLFLGDCMLGRLVNDALENAPPDFPWGDTLPIIRSADWRLCNLECVISNRGTPWSPFSKAFHFRSDSKNIATLKAACIHAVSIANNHVLDYGYDAMSEMLELLDGAKIVHAGAGHNYAQASALAISEACGKKLGLLAFSDNEPEWEATAAHPGILYAPTNLHDVRAKRLLDLIRESSHTVDLLIVSAHWGSNWGYAPPKEHLDFARALIDAGADIVYGHSCHVFRGIEFYRGRPILYSTGNFVDDYAVDRTERNDQSFIFVLNSENRISSGLRLYPTLIGGCRASRAQGALALCISNKMRELCAVFGTHVAWNEERQCAEISNPYTEGFPTHALNAAG